MYTVSVFTRVYIYYDIDLNDKTHETFHRLNLVLQKEQQVLTFLYTNL